MYPDYLQKSIEEMNADWLTCDTGKTELNPITQAALSEDIALAFPRGEITLDEVKAIQEQHLRIKFG